MNAKEILVLLLPTILSVIITTTVAFILYRMNKILISGDMEMRLREYINSTKIRLSDMLILKAKSEDTKERIIIEIDNAINISIEEMLNAYEEACAQYLDNKVDRTRFKKMYNVEIRNLVRNDSFNKYFEVGSSYTSIIKIYEEWSNNLDK